MGAPKATDMPDAAAADSTSLFRASFSFMLGKSWMSKFEQQQATWTRGPSLPSHMPEATDKHYHAISRVRDAQDGGNVPIQEIW